MTKREAKRMICSVAGHTIGNDVGVGADWIHLDDEGNHRPSEDVDRILEAIEEFRREMDRRSGDE